MSQVRVLPAEPIKTRARPEAAGPRSISLCVRDSGASVTAGGIKNRAVRRAGGCPAVACGVLPRGGREARFLTRARGLPALRPAVVPERHARRGSDQPEKNSDHNHRPGSPPSMHRPCAPRIPAASLIFHEAQRLDRPFASVSGSETWRVRGVAGPGRGGSETWRVRDVAAERLAHHRRRPDHQRSLV